MYVAIYQYDNIYYTTISLTGIKLIIKYLPMGLVKTPYSWQSLRSASTRALDYYKRSAGDLSKYVLINQKNLSFD